ncbi:MAG: phage portal protein, partial [Bacillota bacterium]|nr:phage portal protein [Bacillota bacterium]
AFIKFINCDITEEKFQEFKELGAIKVKSMDGQKADVDVVKTELNQDQVQTMTNSLYSDVLTICGMPNRNGGSSTSDTGSAVVMRDGWEAAETRAKDSETMFKSSEAETLKLVLKICGGLREGMELKLSDIEVKFTRRNYEAIQSKSQVLISMLNNEKIHPLLAFEHSGMFSDPESAYLLSMKHYEEQARKWEQMSEEDIEDEEEKADVRDDGQIPEGAENQS